MLLLVITLSILKIIQSYGYASNSTSIGRDLRSFKYDPKLIKQSKQALYSSYSCQSKDPIQSHCDDQFCKTKSVSPHRSCLFKNICYNSDNMKWTLYHDGDGSG